MNSLDFVDRILINHLQDGIDICERPFAFLADALGLEEEEITRRLAHLVERGILSRFGPLFDAERLGGGVTLVALRVPEADFERTAAIVNARTEVAHNYARDHAFNMWFVITTENPEHIEITITAIERDTGLKALVLPRLATFHLGLRFKV